MNFLLSRVQLCSNFAPLISHPAGPTPIKQIKFLPEIPTKKSQALPPSLGVLTSLVRDPCIVSTGGIPVEWARKRMKRKGKKGSDRGWKQVGNGRESRLLFVTFRGHLTRTFYELFPSTIDLTTFQEFIRMQSILGIYCTFKLSFFLRHLNKNSPRLIKKWIALYLCLMSL